MPDVDPHDYEVKAGLLIAAGIPQPIEHELMQKMVGTWGKTWHVVAYKPRPTAGRRRDAHDGVHQRCPTQSSMARDPGSTLFDLNRRAPKEAGRHSVAPLTEATAVAGNSPQIPGVKVSGWNCRCRGRLRRLFHHRRSPRCTRNCSGTVMDPDRITSSGFGLWMSHLAGSSSGLTVNPCALSREGRRLEVACGFPIQRESTAARRAEGRP